MTTPAADSIPTLIVLGGVATIAGPNGRRTLPVEEFCVSPGRNALAPDELLVSIHFPAPAANSGARFLRFIPRNEMDIAVVNAAGPWVNNVIGRVGIADLLQPRLHDLTEEHHRARTLFGPPSQPPGDRTRAASI